MWLEAPNEERVMDFAEVIAKWRDETIDAADEILQVITFKIGQSVVMLSPVDTGRFRGNWQLTIGRGSDMSLMREDQSGASTLSEMSSTIRSLSIGQVAYIQNHVLYGFDLEHGSSPQARDPDGMVMVTAAKFNQIVQAAIAQVV